MRPDLRYLFAAALLGAAAFVSVDLAAQAQSAAMPARHHLSHLTSEKISLPFGAATFAGGESARLANSRCLLCHSKDLIDQQPPLSREGWKKEVDKMRTAYGCPLRADQSDGLAAFVAQAEGQPAAVSH